MRVPLLLFLSAFSALAQSPADLEAVVTTDLGVFRFEFAADKAPKHVEHFIKLAREGFYDGGAFHRVVAYGIIQGGDPLLKDPKTPRKLWGTGGLNQLAGEFSDLKHERGVVSTVSIPNKPDSDGAQFFVCISPQPPLDGKFSAFGRVTEGMDVVEKISQSAERRRWHGGEAGPHPQGDDREEEGGAVRQRDAWTSCAAPSP